MRLLPCFLLFATLPVCSQTPSLGPYAAVSPLIGTAGGGNTFPGATLPSGMMQWGPDTRDNGWYEYSDSTLRGFSLTHISGAGCPVYADLPILPWAGKLGPGAPMALVASFLHGKEKAHPGSYQVELDSGIGVELSVARRSGIGRFLFPAGVQKNFVLKAAASANAGDERRAGDASSIEIRGDRTLAGQVHSGGFCGVPGDYTLYFFLEFNQPFTFFGVWSDMRTAGELEAGARRARGHGAGAAVGFAPDGEPVLLKAGISFVSRKNAEANLRGEIPGWDIEHVRGAARAEWETALGQVDVDGGTAEERTIFYTGLYHMLLSPNVFSDLNGDSMGFDGKVRRLAPGEMQYANFSDWDIYRDVIQMQALLDPAGTSQKMQSLVRDADQSGWLPRWPVANDVSYVMGGDSPTILLSTAYAFGARGFDVRSALAHAMKGATESGTGPHDGAERPHLDEYLHRGFVPVGGREETGASVTLEYASADFAVSRLATAMGDLDQANRLLRQAQNWRSLFDEKTGMIRPRTEDGNFVANFDVEKVTPHHVYWDQPDQLGFEEGNTWHYTWMIPFNYAGLTARMGGGEKAALKLDKFFEKVDGWAQPNFTVNNEPDFCTPYVYLWLGQPWKTQAVVDRIRRETFSARPAGIPGNDDLGATSGVYVWSALGFYPVIPGVGGLALGTPLFPKATMKLGAGRELEIARRGEGVYVQSVTLNGAEYDSAWLPLDRLEAPRSRIVFTMGTAPNRQWATLPEEYPPSFDVPEK